MHALALAVLVLSVRLPPPMPEPPPVTVSLIDFAAPGSVPRPEPPPPRLLSPRPSLAAPVDAPPPPPALRGTADIPPPAPPAPGSDFMSFFAERVAGCEREALMLLSASDLDACRARIAAVASLKAPAMTGPAPDLGRLPALTAAWRAALDAETARREGRRGSMGNPVAACEGPRANLGAGCLAAE